MTVIMSLLLCFVDSSSPSAASVEEDGCCLPSEREDECDLCRRDDDDDAAADVEVCSKISSPSLMILFSLDTPMLVAILRTC